MAIEVRPLLSDAPDEDAAYELLLKVDLASFSEDPVGDELKAERAVLELDRALIAWDGSEPVGCSTVYSHEMSVPGGTLPCAGVTWVGVLPTHRRRGVMSAMLGYLHDTARDARDEPIAGLWSAQPPIYPRFGYGLASRHLWFTVQRAHGSLSTAPTDPSLRLRLIAPTDDEVPTGQVYAREMQSRPGMTTLTNEWWARSINDPKDDRDGASSLRTVVVEDDEGPRGYARYSFKHEWAQGYGDGQVNVRQLIAIDPAAEAELWRYLIDFELSGRLDCWNLPVDTPLAMWLDQPRHHKQQVGDALYIKFLDLPKAIGSRSFSQPLDIVVDVTEDEYESNRGKWRISGDESGATCERTSDSPDLSMSAARLAATYLGGTSFTALASAGFLEEHTKGAAQHATPAFVHHRPPWSPFVW